MFKLAELFVSIAADTKPMDAVVGGLKGKMASTATAIGGAFSGAFTSALGPVGLAYTAASKLFGMVEEGNEDVAQLGTYWASAMEPIKEAVTGVVHQVTEWSTGLIEMVKTSDAVQSAFATFTEYAAAGLESVKDAIDRGVEVFNAFKTAATEAFTVTVAYLRQTYESLSNTFGGPGLALVTSWGALVKEWVVDKIELVGIAVRNWPDIFEMVWVSIRGRMENIGQAMATIPANAKIIGEYLSNNWVALITDGINAVGAAFKNLGTYIGELAYAVFEFFKDPTKGIKMPEWKGLLDGFKATADALPELLQPTYSSVEDELSAIADRIAKREAGRRPHALAQKAAEEAAAAAAATAGGGEFKSQIIGVAEFARSIRQSGESEQNKVAKEQLAEAKKASKALEKLAEKKDPVAVMG